MFMNFYVSKELENHCLTAIGNIYILHTTDHQKLYDTSVIRTL